MGKAGPKYGSSASFSWIHILEQIGGAKKVGRIFGAVNIVVNPKRQFETASTE
jgi:hypothetical protein